MYVIMSFLVVSIVMQLSSIKLIVIMYYFINLLHGLPFRRRILVNVTVVVPVYV